MDIKKLSIDFYRDFEKEYFEAPKNAYLDYEPWDLKQQFGTFPKVNFAKKDPIVMIVHKGSKDGKELWLHEDNGRFVFRELECIKKGYDTQPPLMLWVEYTKEPTFILYKTHGYGRTKKEKSFFAYREENGYIYMKWVDKIMDATVFSYSTGVDWSEHQPNLVAYKKRF